MHVAVFTECVTSNNLINYHEEYKQSDACSGVYSIMCLLKIDSNPSLLWIYTTFRCGGVLILQKKVTGAFSSSESAYKAADR